MTADTSVRPARGQDAAAIGKIQLAAWLEAYRDVLPAGVLDQLSATDLAAQWHAAAEHPPSPNHRVLVALEGEQVVGFAAFGPATDPDRDADRDAELLALVVAPDAAGRGHGSRLLAAAAEQLRDAGFGVAVSWLLEVDERLAAFLLGAGWAPDGARRELDVSGDGGVTLRQLRLHTDLR